MLQQKMHGKPFIYLDSAATTHKPICVLKAMHKFYSEEYATVHRSVYDFASQATEKYQAVREKLRVFLNAREVEEVIFTKGTTDSINLVASSFSRAFLKPGDEIIITQMEHHSNFVPWKILCEEQNLRLKCIPINARGELIMEEFEKLLTSRTKLVCVAQIANSTGTVNPIAKIIALAHAKGAKVLVDGAQGVAHTPVDVQKSNVDFYAFSSHKMYGPTGLGVLYGKRELLEQMPPYQYGGDMVDHVSLDQVTFAPLPIKFEAGTPVIAAVMGLGAAVDFIESLGRERIAAWEAELLSYATSKLEVLPNVRIIGTAKEKGGIISFVINGLHALDIGTLLDLRGVAVRTGQLCAQPTLAYFQVPSLIRVSFGVYTSLEDIDIFIDALSEAMLLLRPAMSY
jgi:cysteine desulfurase/selenocysteine lyase